MRIGILGPLEMRDEGRELVRLGGPRLRALRACPASAVSKGGQHPYRVAAGLSRG